MYAAKVKIGLKGAGPDEIASEAAEDVPGLSISDEVDTITFSAGNPRVEHVTGVVHLFKEVPATSQPIGPLPALPVIHDEADRPQ